MASFAAFAAGYLARPIGGIVLSHYGDRYGRRARVPVVGVRDVRRHARHGPGAVVRAVGRRGQRADGRCCGWCRASASAASCRARSPTSSRRRRGIAPFVCGVVFACVTMGVAVATGVSLSVRTFLTRRLVPAYGWRIAFVLGGLGGVLSFVLRRSLEESPEFARMKQPGVAAAVPRAAADAHVARSWSACAVLAGTACFNGLFFSHLPAYLVGGAPVRPAAGGRSRRPPASSRPRSASSLAGWLGDRDPAALSAARRAWRCCCCFAFPFYRALETRTHQPDAAAGARRPRAPASRTDPSPCC